MKRGLCSADSIINLLLCCLGFIPGLLHSWYIIAKYPDPYDYDYDSVPQDREGSHHVIYVVSGQPRPQSSINYGTTQGQQARPQQQRNQPQQQGVVDNGAGSSDNQGVPPSYAEVVAGDNKIQSRD